MDTVVTTWTMCSIPNLPTALAEVRRVLKADGRLLFAEHGLSKEANVVRWQNRLTPIWKPVGGGCHLNRPIDALIAAAGFGSLAQHGLHERAQADDFHVSRRSESAIDLSRHHDEHARSGSVLHGPTRRLRPLHSASWLRTGPSRLPRADDGRLVLFITKRNWLTRLLVG